MKREGNVKARSARREQGEVGVLVAPQRHKRFKQLECEWRRRRNLQREAVGKRRRQAALILTQTESAMTLPVGIASRVTQYEIKWGAMSAAGVVAMLPVLIFASVAQRYLVRGLSLGAVKG